EEDKDKLYHHVQLKDQDCQVFYDKLHFIYLELSKFKKPLSECKSHYEKWLWVFKNLPKQEEIPSDLQIAVFKKVFKIAEVAKLNPKEQDAYQESLKNLWDLKNVVDTAFKDGRTTGLEEGEAIGLEKGEAIGLEKGEAIGLEKGENKGIALTLKIIQLYNQQKSIEAIAKTVEKDQMFVNNVLRETGLIE
ncbi:MAG: PD-(D/E)XK nuclease family transposase, partial [Bacteroidota bacterium]